LNNSFCMNRTDISNIARTGVPERNNIDQALGRNISQRITQLMKTEQLTRVELLELATLLASEEVKLLFFSNGDRRLLGQLTTYINELIEILEIYFDYQDDKNKHIKEMFEPELLASIREYITNHLIIPLSHTTKVMVNVFLYGGRSSLSSEARAFENITSNKQSVLYEDKLNKEAQQNNNNKGLMRG
jgi:hypothetical protein